MNSFTAIGRIASEIRLQQNEKGVIYARFPLAIWRGKNKEGEDRGSDFPMITVFGKQAENLQKYSGKGKRIALDAHIKTGKYIRNGEERYSTSIIADKIEYLDWKEQDEPDPQEDTFLDDYNEEQSSLDDYMYDDEGDLL